MMRGSTAHQIVTFTVRAVPIPPTILDFILENITALKTLIRDEKGPTNRGRRIAYGPAWRHHPKISD